MSVTTHEGLISVQAAWNGWRSAEVRLGDLRDLHWLEPDGAHSRLLHAWIDCSDIVLGSIPHDCTPPSGPHRLRVCVLKSHTLPGIYAQLAARALDAAPLPSASVRT